MKPFTSKIQLVVLLSAGFLLTACATYYKVTDPTSGTSYYTEKVKQDRGGAAKFEDARSGAQVTVQNSEVLEISEREFDMGRTTPISRPAQPPAIVPAPALAPAPAPAPSAAPAPSTTPAPSAAPAPSATQAQ